MRFPVLRLLFEGMCLRVAEHQDAVLRIVPIRLEQFRNLRLNGFALAWHQLAEAASKHLHREHFTGIDPECRRYAAEKSGPR